ncbi:MAG: methionyl-tRNA formyltransferase [Actinobacteria bacterium]|uniref:methionyl-tRNA formyltransferase n=1 Tax=freshwater metagenome TaxID=449393 RepID=A0A6J7B2U7_9ZZZZ|nr:methionyl-tRNA formyltransferase [Actinomycetota bacterium]
MLIAIAATPAVAIPTIKALLASKHTIAFLITQPDRPSGRGQVLTPTEVALWAAQNEIPVFKPEGHSETLSLLSGVDLLLTIGYGVLLPQPILSAPQKGCLNLHFSLLPRWRGAAPVQRAIESGDLLSGVTVFQLDEGMDTGPIYSSKRFALDSDITSDELFVELGELGVEAVLDSLEMIENGVKPVPQTSVGVTRALKLSKDEGRIDWAESAEIISRKVRAFTSSPGAWTSFRGSNLKVDTPTVSDLVVNPGELLGQGRSLFVGTKTTAIEIGWITPSGKTRMSAQSWLNGIRLEPGERFG